MNKISEIAKHGLLLIGSLTFSSSMAQNYEAKVESLMKRMTLQEKIGQTVMYSGSWDQTGPIVGSNNGKFIREGKLEMVS